MTRSPAAQIISVSAPCNGSGKTSLILAILKSFPEVFCVTKFTTIYAEEQFCPVKDHDCACHRLQGEYMICSDPEVLSQPDTDTGKMWNAGAIQVLWCVARHEGYPLLAQEFLTHHLGPEKPLLMEGNTITKHIQPQLSLFVVNPCLPESWWKRDAQEFLQAADYVLVNPYASSSGTNGGKMMPWTQSVLGQVREKCVMKEVPDRLDQWKDRRIYDAVSQLVAERRV
jgi:hypothetical protein